MREAGRQLLGADSGRADPHGSTGQIDPKRTSTDAARIG